MCGIAGWYNLNGAPIDKNILEQMTRVLRHRGPDDEGFFLQGNLGLGHRRLSIIDTSSAGKQPMSNENGKIRITYNGEIYNFKELKEDLIRRGHVFRSHTDTEVIVHLYEELGTKCLEKLTGMFAFGLWDDEKKILFLARDRIGIKPLFYYTDNEKILFGSEIKSILANPAVERKLNLKALHHFLFFNYVPAPLTMFQNICQLLPGHYLIHQNGKAEIREYWDLKFQENNYKNEKYYSGQLEDILHQTTQSHLVSDVAFGSFLSGGVDSSTIVYFMSQILKEPVKTFSIGFKEKSYNELPYARMVAKKCSTEHYELEVQPDAIETLQKLVWHSEEPLADQSMMPVYYVSKLASEHVKMVLSGDGGDEIFAGYETYQAYYLRKLYRFFPRFIRKNILAELIHLLPVSEKKISWDYKLKRFVNGAEESFEDSHMLWRVIFDEKRKRELYSDKMRNELNDEYTSSVYHPYFKKTHAKHPLNKMLYVDTRFYLPNDMLVKVDRMSMAHSLEVRVPMLDHKLVEFAATLPPNLKLHNFTWKKYLLKKIMRNKLPYEILYRKKQGFNVPIVKWLKNDLKIFVNDILSQSNIQSLGLFNEKSVSVLLHEHFTNKKDSSYQIYGLLIFFLWWEKFMRNKVV